jgi:hypothetical protein
MKENRGHARCNAYGIRHLSKNDNYDFLILMDGDGEDRPEEIKLLVDKALLEPSKSVVAKRIKRSEGPLFQMFYRFHKYKQEEVQWMQKMWQQNQPTIHTWKLRKI